MRTLERILIVAIVGASAIVGESAGGAELLVGVDYGVQIQARSRAEQTILIQLAAAMDFAYYVPTPRAVQAGGYSAEVTHNLVGPEGAQVLVDRTVEAIGELWNK